MNNIESIYEGVNIFKPNNKGDIGVSHKNLTSLEGAPREVRGSFYCNNNSLNTLLGGPEEVGGSFYCSVNKLTSLEGAPREVGGNFCCEFNKITSLDWFPEIVEGNFHCEYNSTLPRSELYKIIDKVGGDIYYIDWLTPEDKDQLKRERVLAEILKHDELGNLDM